METHVLASVATMAMNDGTRAKPNRTEQNSTTAVHVMFDMEHECAVLSQRERWR